MSPLQDSALKGAQLTIGEDAGEFTLQAHEELSTDAVGLGLEARAYTRPRALERILARPPITRGPGRVAMGRANLAVLPRSGLPWIAFWLKEIITWGTLEPVAAFLLARGDAVDRPQAEREAAAYYAQLPDGTDSNEMARS